MPPQRSCVSAFGGVAARADEAGDRRHDEDDPDDRERESDRDLGNRVVLLVQVVQDQLDADEAEDEGEAGRQVDQPVEQPGDQEVQRPRPSSAKAFAAKTMYASSVTPNTAGIESSANRMSVVPIAISTRNIGVKHALAIDAG